MRADAAEKVDGKWLRDGQSYKTREKKERREGKERETMGGKREPFNMFEE